MNKQAYSYSVLRYVHDVTTGEFVNVGLALYCPGLHYANATCRTTAKRLRRLFPSLDSDVFRALMRKVQTRFEALHDEVNSQLVLRPYASVMELAQIVRVRLGNFASRREHQSEQEHQKRWTQARKKNQGSAQQQDPWIAANTSRAAAATRSAVKPNFSSTNSPGADAPKRSMPSATP